jgi:hypothetical protein
MGRRSRGLKLNTVPMIDLFIFPLFRHEKLFGRFFFLRRGQNLLRSEEENNFHNMTSIGLEITVNISYAHIH